MAAERREQASPMLGKLQLKQMHRRSQIIEAVLPLLSSVPFSELSIAEICRHAGISVGTFYHYFARKSDLLVGLVGLIDSDLLPGCFPLLTSEDELENLRCFAHCWAVYVDTHGLERSKLISGAEPATHYVSGKRRVILDKLDEIFRRGQEKGQICPEQPPEKLTELFLTGIRGVCVDWSRRDGHYSVVERMDEFVALLLKGLRC